jgi:hypothetical protein
MRPVSSGASALRSRWFEPVTVAFLLVAAVAIRAPTLGQPLLEAHGFRQTQTAYTALIFRDEGISLLHSRLPVLGPPFEVPFELPVFQAIGSLVMHLGVAPDPAMRVTGLAFFLLTGLLLYLFVRRFASPFAAGCTLFAFLFAPFGYLWGRTSLMEYMATAAAVGFVWAAAEWRERGNASLGVIAIAAGCVACLVKVTTGALFLVPILLHSAPSDPAGLRGWITARLRPMFLAILAVPIAAAVAWTAWADHVKDQSPATSWLTSRALRTWNFGTLEQRSHIANWDIVSQRVIDTQLGLGVLDDHVPTSVANGVVVVLALVGLRYTANRPLWLGWMLAAVGMVAVFFNLHLVHDYYQAALSPISATVVGLAAAALIRRVPGGARRVPLLAAVVVAVAWLGFAFGARDDGWARATDHIGAEDGRLEIAARIDRATTPDELVVLAGLDWSPEVLYYARRRGLMLRNDDPAVRGLLSDAYRLYVAADPEKDSIEVLGRWRWFGPVDVGTYRVGATRRAAGMRDVVATSTPAEPPDGAEVLAREVTVPCAGRGVELPAWQGELWILLRPAPGGTRIRLSRTPAPLPAVEAIVVRSDGSSRELRCSGPADVVLARVLGA